MPATTPDFEDLIKTIRSTTTSPEEKKVASATIALRLIRSQALGGTISAGSGLSDLFDSAQAVHFASTVSNIQSSITNM